MILITVARVLSLLWGFRRWVGGAAISYLCYTGAGAVKGALNGFWLALKTVLPLASILLFIFFWVDYHYGKTGFMKRNRRLFMWAVAGLCLTIFLAL